MVSLGQRDGGLPAQEGVYLLQSSAGTCVPADVDADGDVDLVVGAPDRYGEGGIYVLRNTGLGPTTAVGNASHSSTAPDRFVLGPTWPNPFNAGTTIPLHVDAPGSVDLTIFNLVGQRVRTLALGVLPAGAHTAHWDGADAAGGALPSGVYLYWATTSAGAFATGRMMKLE
jgi:flagellar hook capping protein FlgD/FG-GAP repeat protein